MLQNNGVTVEFVDVRSDGVALADLRRFHAAFGGALLNTRSTTWRQLPTPERSREPLDLLAHYPSLMKRPVIEADGVLYLGGGKDVQNSLLG